MRKPAGLVLAVFTMLLAISTAAFGQATGGSVNGQALDQNGAAIENVTVTLKNEATGQTLTTQTTGSGTFSFPNTLGGEYTVTAEAKGFAEATQKVKVLLNQESTVNLTVLALFKVSAALEFLTSGGSGFATSTTTFQSPLCRFQIRR